MRNRKRYPDNWYDTIRPKALAKANYMCTKCKAKHHSIGYRNKLGVWVECDAHMINWCLVKGIKTRKMYLQVAHLDHNPSNNDLTNLQAMCPRCHFINDKQMSFIIRKSK